MTQEILNRTQKGKLITIVWKKDTVETMGVWELSVSITYLHSIWILCSKYMVLLKAEKNIWR